MKINFDAQLYDLDNRPIFEGKPDEQKEVTLKTVSINAMLTPTSPGPNQPSENGRSKLKNYKLAKNINKGGIVELEAEEISSLKEKIGKIYSAIIVGSAYELLENPEITINTKKDK